MPNRILLYYVTDRKAFHGDESLRQQRVLEKIAEAADAGVDYIQLREKDLSSRALENLTVEAIRVIRGSRTLLLVNSRTDVAIAAHAHGVHLRDSDISPSSVREVWSQGLPGRERSAVVSVSCHSAKAVVGAKIAGANLVLFAPVFEKKEIAGFPPQGLAALREACRAEIPVLALGGVTLENFKDCLLAGASGIAAIRLFQECNVREIVQRVGGR